MNYELRITDKEYPPLLREISDPPAVLYIRSECDLQKLFADFCLGVAGSRIPTDYGVKVTKKLIAALVKKGVVIVSGLAYGIDYIAHKTTLENEGRTIAVLGSGLDIIYPREHGKMAEEIVASGALVSEFAPGTRPARANFPRRNRIIAGISRGVLITEAAARSGSLIIAACAAGAGRDVFAVPGNITSPTSFGTNFLIKNGAKLVAVVDDVLEEYLQGN